MGCGLRKMKPTSEENSPGKIYSTLKRPQVETKVGVAYTYRYLDFLIGKDGGTSTLRLSSVRELPSQLQELYQQGFVLAAVHPFVHPCGPESNGTQHQLYRAILVRLNDGVERSQPVCPAHKLQLEECLTVGQVPTPELIQGYVKKQIQDAADQGVKFVGFIQEPYGAPCTTIREPETPSLSLHSSPSSLLGSLCSRSPSNPSSPRNHAEPGLDNAVSEGEGVATTAGEENGNRSGVGADGSHDEVSSITSPISEMDLDLKEENSPCHNNNKDGGAETKERPRYRLRIGDGVELLALFNHPPVRESQAKYYTVKVPLRVQNCEDGVKGVEANWLDHMTQHFNNGATLVDGFFYLGNMNDLLPKSVESVFIFQEASEGEANAAAPTYDAIVVEQWTVIDGLQVKADYVPLLQSLATYGWRLTCVLPTPVIKTNSDGSLSTKQVVFLQRPVMGRKKRESKKLIFKPRGKSNKNCVKEPTKNKRKKKAKSERDAEDGKILDDREKAEREEDRKSGEGREEETCVDAVSDSGTMKEGESRCEEDNKIDDGVGIGLETVEEKETKATDKAEENRAEDMATFEGEGAKMSEQPEEQEAAETVASVEAATKTKEAKEVAEVEVVIENGVETDDDDDDDEVDNVIQDTSAEGGGAVEVIGKAVGADPQAAQSPEETQE